MILIEELSIDGQYIKFYRGMDFDRLINHSKDGRDGFIFCFIKNYKEEIVSYERQKKINTVIEGLEFQKFDWKMLENDFISIYQTEGIDEQVVYNTVKDKVLKNQFPDMPWIPISGVTKGAWKLQ